MLNLFRGDSIAFGGAYRWNPPFSILNSSVTPLGGEEIGLSASPMGIPAADKPMPLGFIGSAAEFTRSHTPRSTDTKFTTVNSDRTDSRQYCLPWNAGIEPRTGDLAPVISKTRSANDANAARYTKCLAQSRHVPTANTVGLMDVFEHINTC